jgi:hypothetical protein
MPTIKTKNQPTNVRLERSNDTVLFLFSNQVYICGANHQGRISSTMSIVSKWNEQRLSRYSHRLTSATRAFRCENGI